MRDNKALSYRLEELEEIKGKVQKISLEKDAIYLKISRIWYVFPRHESFEKALTTLKPNQSVAILNIEGKYLVRIGLKAAKRLSDYNTGNTRFC